MKRTLVISLIIVLSLIDVTQANDNFSISVSCSIPAVPGLNVPFIEKETLETQADTAATQQVESQQESQPQSLSMIQQDTQEEKKISQEQKSLVLVKTIYSR